MKYLKYHKNSILMWFRIFGYGFCFRNKERSNFNLTFSERQGLTKYVQLFGWVITILKPNNQYNG